MKHKIKKLEHTGMQAYLFECPGCEMTHMIPVSYTPEYLERCRKERPGYQGTTWKFNGSYLKPTFEPSLSNTWNVGIGQLVKRCHLFVREGKLQFCSDSTHKLSGQTVEMPDADP